jgi:hypothetical protein
MEEWRQITDFPDYEVSNQGRVRRGDNILSQYIHSFKGADYKRLGLFRGGKQYQILVHRLVGQAFILNPENKPQIDHIDRNGLNNLVENLKWATASENSLNRDMKVSVGGDRHIYKTQWGTFCVQLRRGGKQVANKKFKTLEEAKAYRDELLVQL